MYDIDKLMQFSLPVSVNWLGKVIVMLEPAGTAWLFQGVVANEGSELRNSII